MTCCSCTECSYLTISPGATCQDSGKLVLEFKKQVGTYPLTNQHVNLSAAEVLVEGDVGAFEQSQASYSSFCFVFWLN